MVFGVDEERGVLGSEMNRVLPGGVALDVGERPAPEWLYPPHAATPGEHHNALSGSGAFHTCCNGVECRGTAGIGARNSCELDRRIDGDLGRSARYADQTGRRRGDCGETGEAHHHAFRRDTAPL